MSADKAQGTDADRSLSRKAFFPQADCATILCECRLQVTGITKSLLCHHPFSLMCCPYTKQTLKKSSGSALLALWHQMPQAWRTLRCELHHVCLTNLTSCPRTGQITASGVCKCSRPAKASTRWCQEASHRLLQPFWTMPAEPPQATAALTGTADRTWRQAALTADGLWNLEQAVSGSTAT